MQLRVHRVRGVHGELDRHEAEEPAGAEEEVVVGVCRVNLFKEKLLEHQECEEKIFMAKDQLAEEQLLDDLEDFETADTYGQS